MPGATFLHRDALSIDASLGQFDAAMAFFSLLMLNLPSGLTLYIFVNNILSILQQIYLRRAMRPPPASSQTLAVTPRRA